LHASRRGSVVRKEAPAVDFTQEELEEYWKALKDTVCSKCRGSGYEGMCRIGKEGVCPFDLHLPRLVEAVLSTPRSNRVADYIPNVRAMVCSHCENEDAAGSCHSRDLVSCGLDSYILLVVQTVEEVHDRLRSSRN
jgi:hypothetical protein